MSAFWVRALVASVVFAAAEAVVMAFGIDTRNFAGSVYFLAGAFAVGLAEGLLEGK